MQKAAWSLRNPADLATATHLQMHSIFAIHATVGGPVQLPKIAITIGDPAGVGAEIALNALADPDVLALAEWIVIGDHSALDAVQPGYQALLAPRVRFISPGALDPAVPIRFGE